MKTKRRCRVGACSAVLLALMIVACGPGPSDRQEALRTETATDSTRMVSTDTTRNVPFTMPPAQPVWRLGFAGAPDVFFIELLPAKPEICDERDQLVSEIASAPGLEGAVLLAFGQAAQLGNVDLLNPPTWTMVDMKGRVWQQSFSKLAAVASDVHTGCYYLTSGFPLVPPGPLFPIEWPKDQNLIFAIAGTVSTPPAIHLPLFDVPTDQYGQPRMDPEFLPPQYALILDLPAVRAALADSIPTARVEETIVFGNCLVAHWGANSDTLWTINHSWRAEHQEPLWKHWGILRADDEGFVPLYLQGPVAMLQNYGSFIDARFVAALDLDGDGYDELVVGASYYEGNNYRVFSWQTEKLVEVYDSFYYGL